MNVRIVSYYLNERHAELVSASHLFWQSACYQKTLKQVQGDVRFMMYNGYT